MSLQTRVYSVLVISSTERFNEQLPELLDKSIYSPIDVVKSVGAAERRLDERSYDLVLINTPLPDDFGARFAIDLSLTSNTVALMFVKSEIYIGVYDKVSDYGVFTIRKPLNSQIVLQSLDFLKAARERLRRMEKKSLSLQEKMEEIKIVNRAKLLLISCLSMAEDEAHRYIEKQAMDRCVTRREIAENIIKTYK